MPYRSNRELPEAVKNVLPQAAQSVWRNVFNSQQERGLSEERAFASAWAALKNQGWQKGDDGQWHKVSKILKIDAAQQLVFGWASVAVDCAGELITDWQDDQIDVEDLEAAAYQFNLEFRETGIEHAGEAVGHLVESFMVTPEKLEKMGLAPDCLPQGLWVGFYIPDQTVFAKVVDGTFSMFSIQGTALREEV